MASEDESLSRQDIEAKIVKRCWEDEGFRTEFTRDPVGTAVKYLEVPAASLPRIVVHSEAPGSWHIVLPQKPANAEELSEEDLERVAGGVTPTIIITIASAASVAITAGSAASAAVSLKRGW
jgi:hypothetical protein